MKNVETPNWNRILDGDRNNLGTDLAEALKYRADKHKAYEEGFTEFIQTAEPWHYNGCLYHVHPNVNLYIDVTPVCNADCEFCIAKTTYSRNKISNNEYMKRLDHVLSDLKNLAPSIQVVGGEPTVDPKIYEIIDLVDKHQMKRPVLNTNGFGLNERLVRRLNESTFEHINISRHHYHDNLNQEIMRSVRLLGNEELAITTKQLQKNIRVQCNLIGGYIDTYGEIMQFIAYAYHRLGVKNIAFAQLTPLPENDIYTQSIIDYVSKRQVDIDAILDGIGNDSRFIFRKYRGGVACYYEIWEYTAYEIPVTIIIKYSDNQWLVEADRSPQYIPDLVFHTDGTLCGSWNKYLKQIIPKEVEINV